MRVKSLDELLSLFKLRGMLGEECHKMWIGWASILMKEEQLSPERVRRWRGYMVPYDQLDEEAKELDRKQADRLIEVLKRYLYELERGRFLIG